MQVTRQGRLEGRPRVKGAGGDQPLVRAARLEEAVPGLDISDDRHLLPS
jgi:hypothetical protein